MITYDDFAKLELRVGTILDVQPHPNADKLYVLKINLGEKQVQVVAGIKQFYTQEELQNKQVVVVANLDPKIIRGVESNGMVLAAQSIDNLAVITTDRRVSEGGTVR